MRGQARDSVRSPRCARQALLALALVFGVLGLKAALPPAESAPDCYNVVWDSPSADHHGSMPLGNGDIALNAWMTAAGELHFYIGKTDAWDDNGRLLKVGKVRVRFEPNPLAPGLAFRQELNLREGCLAITTRAPAAERGQSQTAGAQPSMGVNRTPSPRPSPPLGAGERESAPRLLSTIRVWVDANHPVIHVTAESETPLEATATIELWRTNRQELTELQTSDIMLNRKRADQKQEPIIVEPDTVLTGQRERVGWFHHNVKSSGPRLLAEIQGLTGFPQADPLLHRTFGAVVTALKGERLDDRRLRSPRGTSHRFSVFVLTRHPSTPDDWLEEMNATIRRVESRGFAARRSAHERWWAEFWDRGWIRAAANAEMPTTSASIVPVNNHPVRLGVDQQGGNRFAGEFGRMSLFTNALSEADIGLLAGKGPEVPLSQPTTGFDLKTLINRSEAARGPLTPALSPAPSGGEGGRFSAAKDPSLALGTNSALWRLASGFTIEAWVKPEKLGGGGGRLVDKITPGGSDGFLLDTFPGNSLRFICGETILQQADALPAERWTHVAAVADPNAGGCRLYVNGRRVGDNAGVAVRDEAAYVSQMYHLQRYITACAGRGAHPIKFNGSLFTVPPGATEADPDFRRWGPGYWWQNTRLPYISLNTSGDFEFQRPLFRMYAEELLPFCQYRTRHYLGHGGAFYPECIYFWGPVFSETYGWTPFEQRADKLQESGWHKWEWVGGLELCWMLLDYYDHTLDRRFLRGTALPFAREILTFFDQHYPTNAQGKLVMHPSQALETWWHCTNAMPELAGCLAVTERLLALPANLAPTPDRALWSGLRVKLPPLPLRTVEGKRALAPAEFYDQKSNIENPELYAVFPFRLIAFNRPNSEWGLEALRHRWDRGHSGWRQDDIFMAYLGLTDEARQAVVGRARSHDRNERFPAFWGPNYDWTPDQDHGGVLMKAFQAMLLQTDGERVFLLPAWPKEWDVEFKLHAPRRTVIEGCYRNGKLEALRVTPRSRRSDVTLCADGQ